MDLEHPNRGHREYHKARVTLLCGVVIFIIVEILIFLWVFSVLGHTNSDGMKTKQVDKSLVQLDLSFDETIEWHDSVQTIADRLIISFDDADEVLHQIAQIYFDEFGKQLYFCNEFDRIDGVENHYSISSSDAYARFEVEIVDGHVTYVQELEFE